MSYIKREFDQAGATQQESVAGAARRIGFLAMQVFLLILASVAPLPFLDFAGARPAFLFMAVYYWSVFRPQVLSPLAAFVTGFVLDLIVAGPLALNALTLLGLQRVTTLQRKFLVSQSFPVVWLCFFLASAGAFLFQWMAVSLFSLTLVPPKPMLLAAGLTGLCYPLAAFVLGVFNKPATRGLSAG